MELHKQSLRDACIFLGIFFIASAMPSFTPFRGSISALLYASIIIIWMVTVSQRVVNRRIKAYFMCIGFLCLLWMLLREIKYNLFPVNDTVQRLLWYTYYIREGGGLSFVRRSAEAAGAKLSIEWSPVFLLRIRFPSPFQIKGENTTQ